ncbi:NAD-dependent dehydratase [Variovorax paradoxus]|uniref:NAD-dependent dehydratase n=1 Tax=Variovorax paradoxus TaxID=34073 RepID=A0A0D0MTW5_VARPD|nr:SDR family oxidoreductase [Variovorax paradoxus]KIQ34319.1 NAD-dependent dehydratase [Variovorax paradoxus]
MRVFLTGATGFIGSRVTRQLLQNGHQVLGLCRSEAGARWLTEAGAEVHRGTLEDPQSLAAGAAAADAVIHTAFDHDFSKFVENTRKDSRVIHAMGEALVGSAKPFIITSGTGMGSAGPGTVAVEDVVDLDNPNPRVASEIAAAELRARKVSVAVIRLPQVHDTVKQGLISPLIELARAKGVFAYVGEGLNRWPAAHVEDVALLYRLALDQHAPGACWHAVAEEGIRMRDVAEVIAHGMGIPARSLTRDEAAAHFGWLAMFAELDMPASSRVTRDRLGWAPNGPGLLADLGQADYGAMS